MIKRIFLSLILLFFLTSCCDICGSYQSKSILLQLLKNNSYRFQHVDFGFKGNDTIVNVGVWGQKGNSIFLNSKIQYNFDSTFFVKEGYNPSITGDSIIFRSYSIEQNGMLTEEKFLISSIETDNETSIPKSDVFPLRWKKDHNVSYYIFWFGSFKVSPKYYAKSPNSNQFDVFFNFQKGYSTKKLRKKYESFSNEEIKAKDNHSVIFNNIELTKVN